MARPEGWQWFGDIDRATAPTADAAAASFARCFAGPDGERVLRTLRALTVERALGPEAGETALRHLEGQRQLVLTIQALIARGRDQPG